MIGQRLNWMGLWVSVIGVLGSATTAFSWNLRKDPGYRAGQRRSMQVEAAPTKPAKKPSVVQAVVFDWAGTTVDYGCKAPIAVIKRLFENEGLPVSTDEARVPMGLHKRDHIKTMLTMDSISSGIPSIRERWLEKHGRLPSDEDVERMFQGFLPMLERELPSYSQLIPGTVDTMQFLRDKGVKVGSSTGYSAKMVSIVGAEAKKQKYVPDYVMTSDRVAHGRPAPDMLQENMKALGAEPWRTVKVDDSIPGIEAGRTAGVWTIYVYRSGNGLGLTESEMAQLSPSQQQSLLDRARAKGEGIAHYVVPSIAELPPYINKIEELIKSGARPGDYTLSAPAPLPRSVAPVASMSRREPLLLTPGPITTSMTVKQAMLRDLGSRDREFIETNTRVLKKILALADASATHKVVPLQGSGTFVVEALLQTLTDPKKGKTLVLINGVYGWRMVKILQYLERPYVALEFPENEPVDVAKVKAALKKHKDVTHVAAVHLETTTGLLNPIKEISDIVADAKRELIIDAISAFGAVPVSARELTFAGMAISPNKALQGVPGMGLAMIENGALERAGGHAKSLALDLYDQWQKMEASKQWRFTPPTHVILALDQALTELEAEGGVQARFRRYSENNQALRKGMMELGFQPFLPKALQSPVILTFHQPEDSSFNFTRFYNLMSAKGFVLYPGKLTKTKTFRVGSIGHMDIRDVRMVLAAMKQSMQEMGMNIEPKAEDSSASTSGSEA